MTVKIQRDCVWPRSIGVVADSMKRPAFGMPTSRTVAIPIPKLSRSSLVRKFPCMLGRSASSVTCMKTPFSLKLISESGTSIMPWTYLK